MTPRLRSTRSHVSPSSSERRRPLSRAMTTLLLRSLFFDLWHAARRRASSSGSSSLSADNSLLYEDRWISSAGSVVWCAHGAISARVGLAVHGGRKLEAGEEKDHAENAADTESANDRGETGGLIALDIGRASKRDTSTAVPERGSQIPPFAGRQSWASLRFSNTM